MLLLDFFLCPYCVVLASNVDMCIVIMTKQISMHVSNVRMAEAVVVGIAECVVLVNTGCVL